MFKQIVLKLKFNDFQQTTAEGTGRLDPEHYAALLDTSWRRGQRPVRLLGVGVRLEPPSPFVPLTLFDD